MKTIQAGMVRFEMMQAWRWMVLCCALMLSDHAWAVDSYRFLHVTIDTPWYIFIFLFFLVFAPMILMAVLHWRTALKRSDENDKDQQNAEGSKHD